MSKVGEILDNLDYGVAPEAAGSALDWISKHKRRFGHFIGGEWVADEHLLTTLDPATGEPLAEFGNGDAAVVDRAVQAAKQSLEGWQNLGGEARGQILYALARKIQKHSRLFAVLESLDNGKPIRETRDIDIPLVARHFYYHAGWASLLEAEFPGHVAYGVCGQIIPWNFPLLMLAWKIAPALAAGNTVVLKPAEFTPLTALLFAEICTEAGVPKGVVNLVTGDGRTGAAIVEHPEVSKIAFTGSTEVGRIIRRATAATPKALSLELGGKSPFVVFEDADLDSAVEGIVDAIWFNQGQVCCAGSRLLVQESIAEKFLAKVQERMGNLRVGDPLDKATDIGAVVDQTQLDTITRLVDVGVREGAKLYQPQCSLPNRGFFYPPSLLSGVEPSSIVAQEEIFGPVLVAMTFRTPAEAIALANNTVYGLASSVWTQNLDLAHDFAAQVLAGVCWINCTNQFDAAAGFGGYRESGFGREGGREGMHEYLKPKLGSTEKKSSVTVEPGHSQSAAGLDRTHKLYIGGKQVRPDGGYSETILLADGTSTDIPIGNRKDIRNAVEAAESALNSWKYATAFNRSQILYYLAENLSGNREGLERALRQLGYDDKTSANEVSLAISRTLFYAAWADKFEGGTALVPGRFHVYKRFEPIGVCGVLPPTGEPLLGFLSSILPLVAMGNTVVVTPRVEDALVAAELYRIFDSSDVPGGVLNIVSGDLDELGTVLAGHAGVSALWSLGAAVNQEALLKLSAENLKQTWVQPAGLDWQAAPGKEFLRRAVQVKNVWVPFGY